MAAKMSKVPATTPASRMVLIADGAIEVTFAEVEIVSDIVSECDYITTLQKFLTMISLAFELSSHSQAVAA
jgi:hypothetical protein